MESHNIEESTTALAPQGYIPLLPASAPDGKTRRYDRQLRLWAASGQNALESARLLVVGSSATSSSILKNLVLPGVGHFTILDHQKVTPEDVGNNFFLEVGSIGKPRAEEAVRLLLELNDSVHGVANTSDIEDVLTNDPSYILGFTLIITHNLADGPLRKLASLLWSNPTHPPLIVARTAGFLADFTIQVHEHAVVDSHSENAPSLRIDKPFPELLEHSLALDFATMDPTDHGHVPYVCILIRAMHDWKQAHDGNPPTSYAEKQAFKAQITAMQVKADEENFEEAVTQAYRVWTATGVPSDIQALFADPKCTGYPNTTAGTGTSQFWALLRALHLFTAARGYLPLNPSVPDMKADTKSYIQLQGMYKRQADAERKEFVGLLREVIAQTGQRHVEGDGEVPGVSDDAIVEFVKNAHGLKVLRGQEWGVLRPEAIAGLEPSYSRPLIPSAMKAFQTFLALGSQFPAGICAYDLLVHSWDDISSAADRLGTSTY
ncbi:NEDD8-activating enzyme E1 regulatory subunit [Ceratobasidium sp. AG-Ba]|nr:NEDD8-activating enzyme E1 regulatory subunit [Ceratobasidium sp. AG-Ba]